MSAPILYLSASEVAKRLGLKTTTLNRWRALGKGPGGYFHLHANRVVAGGPRGEARVKATGFSWDARTKRASFRVTIPRTGGKRAKLVHADDRPLRQAVRGAPRARRRGAHEGGTTLRTRFATEERRGVPETSSRPRARRVADASECARRSSKLWVAGSNPAGQAIAPQGLSVEGDASKNDAGAVFGTKTDGGEVLYRLVGSRFRPAVLPAGWEWASEPDRKPGARP